MTTTRIDLGVTNGVHRWQILDENGQVIGVDEHYLDEEPNQTSEEAR